MEENNSAEEILIQKNEAPISVGDWVLTILILAIPIVNIIMLFVWAFSSDYSKSKSNFAKANLIWLLISIALAVIFFVIFGSIFSNFL